MLLLGSEVEHEASVQSCYRAAVPAMSQTGQVPQAALLSLFFPFSASGAAEIPYARLEHCLRVQ